MVAREKREFEISAVYPPPPVRYAEETAEHIYPLLRSPDAHQKQGMKASLAFVAAAVAALALPGVADAQKITVHLVPHTHDDVGWLKTLDQYFYGSDSDIQNANVQLILDAVTAELARNPDRKFSYVETAFFSRWWRNRPQFHDLVRGFVASGQLSFLNGGWCMHDEANPSYFDMIDQT